MSIKKWTDEELLDLKNGPGGIGYYTIRELAANHIRELQDAVDEAKRLCEECGFVGPYVMEALFWPLSDTREDPNDNWPGHEWS